jgi:hypothetical protein
MPNPYFIIAALIAVAVIAASSFGGGYRVATWRAEAGQKAALAAQAAQINKENQQAIADLKAAMQAASDAALADQAKQAAIVKTEVKWKERLIHAPPTIEACRVSSPHDAAVLDGVRGILAAVDPDAGGADPAAPGAVDGHPAAGPPGPAGDARPTGPADARPGGMGSGAARAPAPAPGLASRLRAVIAR